MIERIAGQPSPPVITSLVAEARKMTLTTVGGAAASGRTRNETSGDPHTPMVPQPQRSARPSATAPFALADPDRPTGPPPTFDANVLEAEAQRRRAGDPSALFGPEGAPPIAAATPGTGRNAAGRTTGAPPATTEDADPLPGHAGGMAQTPASSTKPGWPDAALWQGARGASEPAMDIMR